MAFRRSLADNLAPLLLRVALGATFIWAGWPKIAVKDPFPPEQAALLANLGVGRVQAAAVGASEGAPPTSTTPALPDPSSEAPVAPRVVLAQQNPAPARVYTASDFAGPVELPRLYHVAVMLESAANADKPLWPKGLAGRGWSVGWAHAVAWTEFLAGVFVLVGLFTPLAGLSIACVMGVAMWLTQIGPATVGGGPSMLGFLPPLNNFAYDPMGWDMLLRQFVLFAIALSLLFTGAGALSVDRWIFGKPGSPRRADASYNSEDADDEDEDEE